MNENIKQTPTELNDQSIEVLENVNNLKRLSTALEGNYHKNFWFSIGLYQIFCLLPIFGGLCVTFLSIKFTLRLFNSITKDKRLKINQVIMLQALTCVISFIPIFSVVFITLCKPSRKSIELITKEYPESNKKNDFAILKKSNQYYGDTLLSMLSYYKYTPIQKETPVKSKSTINQISHNEYFLWKNSKNLNKPANLVIPQTNLNKPANLVIPQTNLKSPALENFEDIPINSPLCSVLFDSIYSNKQLNAHNPPLTPLTPIITFFPLRSMTNQKKSTDIAPTKSKKQTHSIILSKKHKANTHNKLLRFFHCKTASDGSLKAMRSNNRVNLNIKDGYNYLNKTQKCLSSDLFEEKNTTPHRTNDKKSKPDQYKAHTEIDKSSKISHALKWPLLVSNFIPKRSSNSCKFSYSKTNLSCQSKHGIANSKKKISIVSDFYYRPHSLKSNNNKKKITALQQNYYVYGFK
ncbi:hypothetical protein BB561_002087 [Smittium simulii]|uniref:Uncharacterized protein n=1 Tax=Smittium simulii TaxID=133385 RepID=A0A2T9YRU4_9FUNG|nr:hypothetical protein BB561_002087 [Smittium simulii]